MRKVYQPESSKFRTCLNAVPVHQKILDGVNVVKVTREGKLQSAYFTLSEDRFTIYLTDKPLPKEGRIGYVRRPKPLFVRVTSTQAEEDEYERCIDIGSVDRIQDGQNSFRFEMYHESIGRRKSANTGTPKKGVELDPTRCFSIIYGGERTLDMMVNDDDVTKDEIMSILEALREKYTAAKVKVNPDVLLLRQIWADVDTDRTETITSNELCKILERINFFMKKSDADKLFHSFAKMMGMDRQARRKGISFEHTVTIMHKIKRDNWAAKPVRDIFFGLFGRLMNNGTERTRVSADSFLRKLVWKKQGEANTTIGDVRSLFKFLNQVEVADVKSNLNYKPSDPNAGKYIDFSRFEAHLLRIDNDIFDPSKERFDPASMHESLSKYFINSSHNTYLTGDQIKSISSVHMYTKALHQGYRCLELDCFDGFYDENNIANPIVYHNYTMVTKIPFFDIIDCINLFLEQNPNSYPVILSLENHCTLPFQERMAIYMSAKFGDKLFIPDEEKFEEPLPSPEELKGKVLIKGRRITDRKEDYYNGPSYETEESDDDSVIEDGHSELERDDAPLSPKKANVDRQSSTTFSPELSKITFFHGVRLNSFKSFMEKGKDCMISISESKAKKLNKYDQHRSDWIKFNQSHFSRVYPSGKRIYSSNFDPMISWSKGVQMCALNYQTNDDGRRLNDGRFRQNGNCGYVLKPPTLLSDAAHNSLTVSIQVFMGSCLPKPNGDKKGEIIDPYVQVTLNDISPVDGRSIVHHERTPYVQNNGFNPIFQQDHPFKFDVENPDVAMISFTVWDRDITSKDVFIGNASIPVACIREGYRSVHLSDSHNKRNGVFECASLLVQVDIKKSQAVKMW